MKESILRRSENVKTSMLPDGYVVLVSEITDWAYTLTPLGGIVWEFCDGKSNAEEVAEQVRSMPELTGLENLDEQIKSLVNELLAEGYLVNPDSAEISSTF